MGFFINQRRIKRKVTWDILVKFIIEPTLSKADFVAHELCLKGETINFDEKDEDTNYNIRMMLSYYELIASAYAENTIDRKTVDHFRSNSMREFYILSREYINEMRDRLKRPSLYTEFENLSINYFNQKK